MIQVLREFIENDMQVTEYTRNGFTVSHRVETPIAVEPVIDEKELLQNRKQEKISELSKSCETSIEEGFISSVNGNKYRTNRDDQINFMGKLKQLELNPEITTVMWKTEDVGYMPLTVEEFKIVWSEGLEHKESQLFKLETLRNQVLAAETIEEVDAVKW